MLVWGPRYVERLCVREYSEEDLGDEPEVAGRNADLTHRCGEPPSFACMGLGRVSKLGVNNEKR